MEDYSAPWHKNAGCWRAKAANVDSVSNVKPNLEFLFPMCN